jgi:hypothetical protein
MVNYVALRLSIKENCEMPRGRPLSAVPITKGVLFLGAFWAFAFVLGLSAIVVCLMHLFPQHNLTGTLDVVYISAVMPLVPGVIVGQIVFMNVQESGATYAVSMSSGMCTIFFVNWGLYFLLFSYFFHWRNKRKEGARKERNPL